MFKFKLGNIFSPFGFLTPVCCFCPCQLPISILIPNAILFNILLLLSALGLSCDTWDHQSLWQHGNLQLPYVGSSSLTWDPTQTVCVGSLESQPPNHQICPPILFLNCSEVKVFGIKHLDVQLFCEMLFYFFSVCSLFISFPHVPKNILLIDNVCFPCFYQKTEWQNAWQNAAALRFGYASAQCLPVYQLKNPLNI